jgi:uncharacterized protein
MSADLPESIDAWRAVTARRIFEGEVPLSRFQRLRDGLVDVDGSCRFRLEFGRDAFGIATVSLLVEAGLPLECQRSLQRFVLPVRFEQQLGLIRNEREEAALPPETEPVLVAEDGKLCPLDLVEDELILALPVVPLAPGTADAEAAEPSTPEPPDTEKRINPFAALAALKQKSS